MNAARSNFIAVYLSHLATAIGMAAFIPFLPYYLAELNVHDPAAQRIWAGCILGAAPLMASLCGPVWGALGDRFGRKLMVLRSLASIVVFVGLMGVATSPVQLLALRVFQGMFSGFVAAGNTLVSVGVPVADQGRVLGRLQTGLLIGLAIGPLLGGLIGDTFGHRPVFFVTAALAFGALIAVWRLAHESSDTGDTAASAAAPRPARGVPARRVPALGDLLRGVRDDVRAAFARPELRALLSSLFLFRFALSMMIPILPVYMLQLQGGAGAFRSTMASLLFVAVAIPILVFVTPWGRRADRRGPGRTFVLCTGIAAIGFLPYAIVGSTAQLIAIRALQGVFLAGILPSAYAAAARFSPNRRRGTTIGVTQSSMQMAMALGPIAGGGLAAVFDLRVVFGIAAALFAAAAWRCHVGWRAPADAANDRDEPSDRDGTTAPNDPGPVSPAASRTLEARAARPPHPAS